MVKEIIINDPALCAKVEPFASLCLAGFWPASRDIFFAHLEKVLGSGMPSKGQQSVQFKSGRMYRVHRHKILVSSVDQPGLGEKLMQGMSPAIGTVSEQSHNKVCLSLSGPSAVSLLQYDFPLDLQHALNPVGSFVQTRLQDANLLVCKTGPEAFDLLVPTSFASSVGDWVQRTAKNIV